MTNTNAAFILRKLLCQRSEFQSQYNNPEYSAQTRYTEAISRFTGALKDNACQCESCSGDYAHLESSLRRAVEKGISLTPDNGYHNKTHAKSVVASVVAVIESYYGAEIVPGVESNKAIDTYPYLVAAAFHDAGHSGNPGPDSEKVRKATALFIDYMRSTLHYSPLHHSRGLIIDMIHSTEFDPKTYPDNETGYVLRDADLIGFVYKEHPEQLAGLADELGIKIETEEDGLEFLFNHYKFYRSLKLKSKYAQSLVNDYLEILSKIVLPKTTDLVYVLRDSRELIFESRSFHNDLDTVSYSPDSKQIKPKLLKLSAEEYPEDARPVVADLIRQANIARTFEYLFELTRWREAKAAYAPPLAPTAIVYPKCNATAVLNRTIERCIGEIRRVTQYLTTESSLDSAYNLLYDMTDSISTEYLKDFKWRNKTK